MERVESRLALIERFPRGGIGAELGVERGDFSQSLLEITKPRELWLVDAWRHLDGPMKSDPVNHDDREFDGIHSAVSRKFCGRPEVRIIRGLLHDVCRGFPARYFDWIYLDACHARECVAEDLRDWWPKLKPGGIFAGHDYWNTSQFPWIDVRPAVDEFLAALGRSQPDIVSVECCGSWAAGSVRKSAAPGIAAPCRAVQCADWRRKLDRTTRHSVLGCGCSWNGSLMPTGTLEDHLRAGWFSARAAG